MHLTETKLNLIQRLIWSTQKCIGTTLTSNWRFSTTWIVLAQHPSIFPKDKQPCSLLNVTLANQKEKWQKHEGESKISKIKQPENPMDVRVIVLYFFLLKEVYKPSLLLLSRPPCLFTLNSGSISRGFVWHLNVCEWNLFVWCVAVWLNTTHCRTNLVVYIFFNHHLWGLSSCEKSTDNFKIVLCAPVITHPNICHQIRNSVIAA